MTSIVIALDAERVHEQIDGLLREALAYKGTSTGWYYLTMVNGILLILPRAVGEERYHRRIAEVTNELFQAERIAS